MDTRAARRAARGVVGPHACKLRTASAVRGEALSRAPRYAESAMRFATRRCSFCNAPRESGAFFAVSDGAGLAPIVTCARADLGRGGRRHRRDSRLGRSRRLVRRLARRDDGGAAGCDGARKPRSGPDGDSQLRFPVSGSRVTVSLAPADVRKVGAAFDLPIALGILAASGVLPHREAHGFVVVGGVSLDGGVPPMRGLLPIAVASRASPAGLVFPSGNLAEAGIVDGLRLFPVRSLMDAARVLSAPAARPAAAPAPAAEPAERLIRSDDLADVRGQLIGRRALEIAAAGAHHLLFSGPPGAGKTMLARRLPGLLPAAELRRGAGDHDDSFGGRSPAAGRRADPDASLPRAAPHVFGRRARRRRQRAAARRAQPRASVACCFWTSCRSSAGACSKRSASRSSRASCSSPGPRGRSRFPARVMLVGAMNPCPCGYRRERQPRRAAARRRRSTAINAAVGPAAGSVRPERGASGGAVAAPARRRAG